MRRRLSVFGMILCFSTAALARADAPTTAPAVSVMPLGDSITAGSDGGYRKTMAALLAEKYKIPITTVGSQTDESLPRGQQAHEGHGGWRIDQLADNLLGAKLVDVGAHGGHWLKGGGETGRGPIAPTFVTVMAGINDINQMIGNDPTSPMTSRADKIMTTLQKRMDTLITTLTDNLPDTTVLMGGCIPYNNGLLDEKFTGATEAVRAKWAAEDGVSPQQECGVNHWVIQFNKWIRDTYVPELQKRGKHVRYVDVYSQFILSDGTVRGWNNNEPDRTHGPAAYGDYGLHPNLFGYSLMGDAWAKAIAEHAR